MLNKKYTSPTEIEEITPSVVDDKLYHGTGGFLYWSNLGRLAMFSEITALASGTFNNSILHWTGTTWAENPLLTINSNTISNTSGVLTINKDDGSFTNGLLIRTSGNGYDNILSTSDNSDPTNNISSFRTFRSPSGSVTYANTLATSRNNGTVNTTTSIGGISNPSGSSYSAGLTYSDGTQSLSISNVYSIELSTGAQNILLCSDDLISNQVAIQQVSYNSGGNPTAWIYLSTSWNNGGGSNEIYIRNNVNDSMTSNDIDNGSVLIASRNSTINAALVNNAIVGGKDMELLNENTTGLGGGVVFNITRADDQTLSGTTYNSVGQDYYIYVDDATTVTTVALLVNPDNGRTVVIQNHDSLNTLIIDGGSKTIDQSIPATTYVLAFKRAITLIYNSVQWDVISFVDITSV